MIVIDASNLIMGRIVTFAVKKAIQGEHVTIINAEKAIVTGTRKFLVAKYRRFREMGTPVEGPFYPRRAKDIMKRVASGMLPRHQAKGVNALKKIMIYNGVPKDLKETPITLENADVSKVPNTKYITLKEISESMGIK